MKQQASILKPGDTIGIVAPARSFTYEALELFVNDIHSKGYNVKFGKTIGQVYHQLSGTADERCLDMQNFIDDPNIKAIWCCRGGYGCVQFVDQLDWSEFKKFPKWLIGFSDITVLHMALQQHQMESLHAWMPVNFSTITTEAYSSLWHVLESRQSKYELITAPHCQSGKSRGILVGGNLSILYSLTGTLHDFNWSDKILFIEDLDEYLYHIDRMMMNLKRCGILSQIRGLIVGGMSQMNDHTIPWGMNATEIIKNIVSEYDYPVVFDFPAGHIDDNRALVLGATYELDVNEDTIRLGMI